MMIVENSHWFLTISSDRYLLTVLALIFVIIHFLSEPLRWFAYTKGKSDNNFLRLFKTFSFSAFASYILPFKLGIPIRLYLLNKVANLSFPFIMKYMVVDSGVYYLCWFLSTLIAISVGVDITNINYSGARPFLLIFATLVSVLIAVSFIKLDAAGGHLNLFHIFITNIKKFITGLSSANNSIITSCALIYTIDIAGIIMRHYFIILIVGSDISLTMVAAITCISFFIGLISMMPMGLIGYDATIVILLQQASLPLEMAILVPVINRSLTIACAVTLGTWSAYSLGFKPLQETRIIKEQNKPSI